MKAPFRYTRPRFRLEIFPDRVQAPRRRWGLWRTTQSILLSELIEARVSGIGRLAIDTQDGACQTNRLGLQASLARDIMIRQE